MTRLLLLAVLVTTSAILIPDVSAAQGTSSAGGHGYLLVRVNGLSTEKKAWFDFTHNETGYVVSLTEAECEPIGTNSKMCIVIAPPGRYFWSKYESKVYFRFELSTVQEPIIRREEPGSATDTFEIAPGVINYIGDWEMHLSSGDFSDASGQHASTVSSRRWKIDIQQQMNSLAMVFDIFPEFAARYEISLSMMGKEAIPLAEFIEIMQSQD